MNGVKRLISGSVLAAVVSGGAWAQTQNDLDQQADREFKAADRALNGAYQRLMTAASPSGKERLRAAQRAWVQFRDADCLARTPRGGSVYPMTFGMCLTGLTEARTKVLNGELKCEEGDLSCGGETGE